MIDSKLLYLIIVAIISSIALSLSLRQHDIKKSNSIMIAIYINILLLVTIFLSDIFSKSMIPFINDNLYFIMVIIGMVLIYTGYRSILEFKNKVEQKKEQITLLDKIKNNLSLILLIIFYYLAIITNIIYTAPAIWMSIFELGLIFTGISFILIILSYLLLYKKIEAPKNLYNGIFGLFLILSGISYFIMYMFIPNLQSVLTEKMTPLALSETNILIYLLIVGVVVILLGFILKRTDRFKKLI